jgi:hypothetical protein
VIRECPVDIFNEGPGNEVSRDSSRALKQKKPSKKCLAFEEQRVRDSNYIYI